MKLNHKLAPVAAAVLAMGAAMPALAGEPIEFGNGLTFDYRITTTYTLSTRLKNADPLLSGAANAGANDGDNNFKKGALTANRLGALFESKLYKGDSGFVLSGSTFYDDAYQHGNDNNPAANNPNNVNKPAPFDQFTDDAKHYHGSYSRLLDAYGYTSFGLGESSRATVRFGRHVVSWGEALFFPGISLAQGPADGTKTGIPGTETKDQLLPEDQISGAIEVTPRWSLLGHAQFNWHPTLAPAPGSYLNSSDGVGVGGVCLGPFTTIPAVPAAGFAGFNGCSFGLRGTDITPSKTGQWGLGTRYRVTDETELGLYYLNYQDRTPLPEINAFTPGTPTPTFFRIAGNQIGNGSYRVRYFDDIKLLGASFSTTFGKVTVAGEISRKQGAPVLVNTIVNPATGATIPNPTRADVTQANLNAFANLGRTPIAPSVLLLGEISAVQVSKVTARKAPGAENFPAAFGFTASDTLSFGSTTAVAIAGQFVLGYPGIFEGWDLSVPVNYSRQISGRSLLGGVGGERDSRYSLNATFTRKSNFSVGLTYLGFLGGSSVALQTNRLLTDRDQLSLVLKFAL